MVATRDTARQRPQLPRAHEVPRNIPKMGKRPTKPETRTTASGFHVRYSLHSRLRRLSHSHKGRERDERAVAQVLFNRFRKSRKSPNKMRGAHR